MTKLKGDLGYTFKDPLYYHIEIAEPKTKHTLFQASNIAGWQDLEKFLQDWRKSQQDNDVDIWIATTEARVITTSTRID